MQSSLIPYLHRLFRLSVSVLLLGSGSACSYNLATSAIHEPGLSPGTPRAQIVAVLGEPQQSHRFSPAVAGNVFFGAPAAVQRATVAWYDEYHINGLVATPDAHMHKPDPDAYGFEMVFTLGLYELVSFPITLVDLTARSTQHYQLRLWYDHSDRLIAEERR